jgi:hypothetical protein
MTVYSDPTLTHLNRKLVQLPADTPITANEVAADMELAARLYDEQGQHSAAEITRGAISKIVVPGGAK